MGRARPTPLAFFFSFAVLCAAPHYPNAWNRLMEQEKAFPVFGSPLKNALTRLLMGRVRTCAKSERPIISLELFYKLEQFSIECRKTKTKVITLANHKGRKAIHCPIKTLSNYTKCEKTCTSKLLLIGQEKGREFFKPITKRGNAKPKLTQIAFDTKVKIAQ